jgi:hypothetical protein
MGKEKEIEFNLKDTITRYEERLSVCPNIIWVFALGIEDEVNKTAAAMFRLAPDKISFIPLEGGLTVRDHYLIGMMEGFGPVLDPIKVAKPESVVDKLFKGELKELSFEELPYTPKRPK